MDYTIKKKFKFKKIYKLRFKINKFYKINGLFLLINKLIFKLKNEKF